MTAKRIFVWVAINGGMAAAMWYGIVENVDGARNVFMFMVWLSFVASLFLMSEEMQKHIKKRGRSVPRWMSVPYDIAVTMFMVWFGLWWSGAAYCIASLMQEGAFINAEKDPT